MDSINRLCCWTEYQMEILENVQKNIENGHHMQTILLPNGGGKTRLSFMLSIIFNEAGKRVLYYSSEKMDKEYASNAIYVDKNRFDDVDFGCAANIKDFYENHYDIVITDSIHGVFDKSFEANFEDNIRNIDVNELEHLQSSLSIGQKSAIGLHYLQKMLERDNSYVISFDLTSMKDIGYAPIISSTDIFNLSKEGQIEYGQSCADEYENVSKKKIQAIIKKEISYEGAQRYDEAMNLLLSKLDEGVSFLGNKIDNLQNDVTQILCVVNELNSTVKDNKNILNIFFSIHDEEDLESDLFISRLVERMTTEISKKVTSFENQDKFQKIRKLVMIRLGEDAWSKMDPDSQKFLVTAKFMFMENMNLTEEVDYSSICLLASKVFEVELAKRFVTEYESYLDSKNIEEVDWPKCIMVKNRGSRSYRRMTVEDFTLGNCAYIMGVAGQEEDKNNNYNYFEMYCKDSLMKDMAQNEIGTKINEISEYIRNVKDNYRNPAAHKHTMGMSEASECLDYILEIERVLKIMLEQFEF